MPPWLPEPTRTQVLEEVARKRPFMGDGVQGPRDLPTHSFRVPGPTKRAQRAWPSFTYFPPPAVIDMAKWRFETYGLVDTALSLSYDELKSLPKICSVEDLPPGARRQRRCLARPSWIFAERDPVTSLRLGDPKAGLVSCCPAGTRHRPDRSTTSAA
jgi:hypothetical protein